MFLMAPAAKLKKRNIIMALKWKCLGLEYEA
jgi:hypothetical protein